MKKHIKTLFLGVVPVFTFTLLMSCAEANSTKDIELTTGSRNDIEVKRTQVVKNNVESVTLPNDQNEELNEKSNTVTIEVYSEEEVVTERTEEVIKKVNGRKEEAKESVVSEAKELIEESVVVVKETVEELVVLGVDHSIWNSLLKKNVSATGKVNYKGFKADKAKFQQYITLLKSKVPTSDWSKNEKLAYWINVYNAFTVKLIVDNYPLKSITNLDKPWDKKFILIQGKSYSLGDVENNVLRKMGESRIHFAINCASVSCPKLLNEAFTADKLSSQLRSVTRAFFSDKTKNQLTDGNLKISKLFEWYATDFSKGNIIAYINKYSGQTINSSSKISYLEYNWNLNE